MRNRINMKRGNAGNKQDTNPALFLCCSYNCRYSTVILYPNISIANPITVALFQSLICLLKIQVIAVLHTSCAFTNHCVTNAHTTAPT